MALAPQTLSAAPRAARRPRWRAYLLLSRVSNVPTVWTNVLAGMTATSAALDWSRYGRIALAVSLFYTAGMFLNDAYDERFDRKARPDRPIPRGDVTRSEVFAAGGLLLAAGEILLAPHAAALLIGLALAAAILVYDSRHKGIRVAPLVMGLCRGLVYCLAAAAASGITGAALAGAAVMTVYVAGLTVVAKLAGANARWLVPALIAGISLVDAIFVFAVSGSGPLALLAAAGFPLTMSLQRVVPGD
jgi:4-hydroxybenzoate polyprenyltransferase